MSPTAPSTSRGCKTTKDLGRDWRLPTLRELQLIWMFCEANGGTTWGTIYGTTYKEAMGANRTHEFQGGKYWCATEYNDTLAWTVDFTPGVPAAVPARKTERHYIRCVSDY